MQTSFADATGKDKPLIHWQTEKHDATSQSRAQQNKKCWRQDLLPSRD